MHKVFDLLFDQDGDDVPEVFGVSKATVRMIGKCLELFAEEQHERNAERFRQAETELSEPELKDLARRAVTGDKEALNVFHQYIDKTVTSFTEMFQAFLESDLFLSIGFTPSTPNHYFILGMIFSTYMRSRRDKAEAFEEAMSPPEEMVDAIKERLESALKDIGIEAHVKYAGSAKPEDDDDEPSVEDKLKKGSDIIN